MTAISVSPGDSSALRAAIDRLIDSPELRKDLMARAYAAGCGLSIEDYLIRIRRLVFEDGEGPEPNERMEASKCES